MKRFNWLKVIITILLGLCTPNLLGISNNDLNEVNSIIDRLEQKLLNQESKSIFFGSEGEKRSHDKAKTSIRYVEENINASLPQKDDLDEISKVISKIEDDVNRMSGEVESLKIKIEANANPTSVIEMSLGIEKPDIMSFRELKIDLSGHTVYQLNHGDGIWMPSKKIPLFKGPLPAGTYKVSVKARVVKKSSNAPFVDTNIFQIYDQVKEITVAEGAFKKGFALIFKDFNQQNQNANIDMAEYEL